MEDDEPEEAEEGKKRKRKRNGALILNWEAERGGR